MGKKYNAVKALVDKTKFYSITDAIELVKKTSITKFDSSIELSLKLNLDTTKAEQQLRGTISLPYYFGKSVKVLVIDDTMTPEKAKACGADFFGAMEKIAEIKSGWLDYDVIVTTPKFMIELSKLGKILGPKGLMPNPKLGTVTMDTVKTVTEIKKGKYNYRTDSYGNIHMLIGKVSSKTEQVAENLKVFLEFIISKRPSTVKGDYIQKIFLSSTMGPSVKVQK